VSLAADLETQIDDGFGPSPDGEDDFDAVVGLFGMLNVILGFRRPGLEEELLVRSIEGWMLGHSGLEGPPA
jgi:hypothetical protein